MRWTACGTRNDRSDRNESDRSETSEGREPQRCGGGAVAGAIVLI
jgi:hypothetical protein